jgi:hypothetical protein
MTHLTETRSDLYVRLSRRSLYALLLVILLLGAAGIAMALRPAGTVSRMMERTSWFIPILLIIVTGALQTSARKHGFTPQSPEVKAVLEDELRLASMDRARKFAFIAVLMAQVPLALLFAQWPSLHALLAMAVATITLGMTSLIALFLVFDRG